MVLWSLMGLCKLVHNAVDMECASWCTMLLNLTPGGVHLSHKGHMQICCTPLKSIRLVLVCPEVQPVFVHLTHGHL